MTEGDIDQIATVKASLELMIGDIQEVHEYFTDLVEKLTELERLDPENRRHKFNNLVEMGAFKFNGLDIRHFTRSQTGRPLPPPLFFNRTRRRLKNTGIMVEEFKKRGILDQADHLLGEIEMLSSNIVNENDHHDVRSFKEKVDQLRESEAFQNYMNTRTGYIQKDGGLKTDSEFIAAKETVEEGEELLRQQSEELEEISARLDEGQVDPAEVANVLESMSFDKTGQG